MGQPFRARTLFLIFQCVRKLSLSNEVKIKLIISLRPWGCVWWGFFLLKILKLFLCMSRENYTTRVISVVIVQTFKNNQIWNVLLSLWNLSNWALPFIKKTHWLLFEDKQHVGFLLLGEGAVVCWRPIHVARSWQMYQSFFE